MPAQAISMLRVVSFILFLCALAPRASEYPLVPKGAAPNLDGRLDDAAWKKAAIFPLNQRIKHSKLGQKNVEATEARVYTDDRNFYFGFTCKESNAAGPYVAPAKKSNSETVLASDNICVLFDAGHWGLSEYALVYLDAGGRLYATSSWWGHVQGQWDQNVEEAGLKAQVHKGAGEWSAELAVPFSHVLRQPKDGMLKHFGLNLRRVQWGDDRGKVKLERYWCNAVDPWKSEQHYIHMATWKPLPSWVTYGTEGEGELWANMAMLDEFGIVEIEAGTQEVRVLKDWMGGTKPEYKEWQLSRWADYNQLPRMPRRSELRPKDGWTSQQPKVLGFAVPARGGGFARKPQASPKNGGAEIAFATQQETDVLVRIVDAQGRVVRHLAAGMLGANPPKPLQSGLDQRVFFDFKDDQGKPLNSGSYRAEVLLGLAPKLERTIPFKSIEKDPAQWNTLLKLDDPAAAEKGGKLGAHDHGGGSGNLAALDVYNNELYLPDGKQYKVLDALTGQEKGAYKPQFKGIAGRDLVLYGEQTFGPNGQIYATGWNEVWNLDRKGTPVPFVASGRPYWPNLWLGHSNPHRGITTGGPDGDIYVIHHNNPHGNGSSQVTQLGADGTLKKYGLIHLPFVSAAGIAVDREGNIYIGCTVNPAAEALPEDLRKQPEGVKKLYRLCYGSIVKFPPTGGQVVFDDAAKDLKSGRPGTRYELHPCRLDNAIWVHPGLSLLLTRAGSPAPHCICRNSRFSLSPAGLLFVPDSVCGRVRVMDTNGNDIMTFGKRGSNVDQLEMRWPETVLSSGTHCYIIDCVHLKCLQLKLDYAVKETVSLGR